MVPVIPGGDASTSDGSAAAVNPNLLSRLGKLGEDQNALAYIAFETGGKYVGGNDLSSTFDEMNRDAAASYELAYYKRALKHDGKFHQIKVMVRRPGLQVRAAGGFFAETGDLGALLSDTQFRFVLNSERPFDGILVSLHRLFFPVTRSDASSVVALVGIGLDWGSSGGSLVPGPTLVLGIVRGPGNRVEEFSSLGIPTELSEKGPLRSSHWRAETWTGPLRITPGKGVIKVAARATGGDLGKCPVGIERS